LNNAANPATSNCLAGYVLAGGGSTRFGQDKALVEVGGKAMLARMVELVREVTKEVKNRRGARKYEAFGVEIVEDRCQGRGRSAELLPRSKMLLEVPCGPNGI